MAIAKIKKTDKLTARETHLKGGLRSRTPITEKIARKVRGGVTVRRRVLLRKR